MMYKWRLRLFTYIVKVFGLGLDVLGTAWYYDDTSQSWVKSARIYEFGVDPACLLCCILFLHSK